MSPEAYVPPQLFYNGKVDYFDLQRLGGLLSHLKKTLKGWFVHASHMNLTFEEFSKSEVFENLETNEIRKTVFTEVNLLQQIIF